MTVATPSAPAAPVLLLTAGNGPWAWSRTRYELVDAALDETVTTYPLSEINAHPRLGHVMRSQTGEHVTFDFGDAPLELHLGATHEEAGVGSQLWDASVALSLFLRSGHLSLSPSSRVVELGAGIGLPSLDLARRPDHPAHITLTDARSKLLSLALNNIDALRQNHASVTAKLDVAPLQWGDAPGDNDVSALAGGVDVAIGSDICYEEACVGPLAALLERLAAPLTLLIGPVGRSSYALLRQRLKASSMLRTEERLLSLVCNNADDHQPATVHSAGVHSLLIVRRDDGAASSA